MYIIRYLALEASAAVLFLPIYLLLNRIWLHNRKKAMLYCLFSGYLACVYALVGLPNVTYIRFDPNVNLIPVLGIWGDLKNCLLNIALFVPLGFLLPMVCERFKTVKTTVLTSFWVSLSIELLQIFAGRATDVNDLITNTMGAALGFLLAKDCVKNRPVVKGTVRELALVLGICVGMMFFVQPMMTGILWTLFFG